MRLSTDDLPMFFATEHHALAERLRAAAPALAAAEQAADEPARDRAAVAALAAAGLFELVAPASGRTDSRALCLAREMLGYVSARADSILAVQGLGTHPIVLAGSETQRSSLAAYARGA
ncbi:MAG TPA: acyl-CoA dehydrogenase family protein, partial [Dokdonella sp.]|nr:acyl-CoA dehydrogenase family protein [Dokdonella sp.]